MTGGPEGLWSFAVALHGRDGVERACLLLQDEAGADVLLLLTACYAAAVLERPLSAADIDDLGALTATWRDEVVAPLRALRRRLKEPRLAVEGAERFRERIKGLEREAESLQMARIEQWLAGRRPQGGGLPLAEALAALSRGAGGAPIDQARRRLEEAAQDMGPRG